MSIIYINERLSIMPAFMMTVSSICSRRFLRDVSMVLLVVALLFIGKTAIASDYTPAELKCPSSGIQMPYSSGSCSSPEGIVSPALPDREIPPLLPQKNKKIEKKNVQRNRIDNSVQPKVSKTKTIVYFFWGKGCPHCEEERQFLDGLKRDHPLLEIRDYEVWFNKENAGLLALMYREHSVQSSGVPVTFVGEQMFSGFTAQTRSSIEKTIKECSLAPCGDPAAVLRKTDHPERGRTAPPIHCSNLSQGRTGEK
jgi:thiol-disulfide isomerase/thioredoxin